jgi:hypothetical protein
MAAGINLPEISVALNQQKPNPKQAGTAVPAFAFACVASRPPQRLANM